MAVPAHQREVRQTRRIQPLAAGAACHDGDIADVLADLRDGDAGEEELELLAHSPKDGAVAQTSTGERSSRAAQKIITTATARQDGARS